MKYILLAFLLLFLITLSVAYVLVDTLANTTYVQCADDCNRLVLSEGVWGIPDPNAPEPQTKAWLTMIFNEAIARGEDPTKL